MIPHRVLILASCLILAFDFAAAFLNEKSDLYRGCYVDSIARVLSGFYGEYAVGLTPQKCSTECRQRRFKYAGMENGRLYIVLLASSQCFCGRNLPMIKVRNNECNIQCTGVYRGGSTAKCGGKWRISVYEVE